MRKAQVGAARLGRADRDGEARLQRVSHRPPEPDPALARPAQLRAQSVQNRIADRITAFAGSMRFVYIHIV
jgi:uncharacterized membrane protein